MSLETRVGTVRFDTPLLLASGFITETPDFFLRSRKNGCSGMVTRSLKARVPPERQRIPAPRYVVPDPNTMLNCEWGNEHPWTRWRDEWAKTVRATGAPLIVSISGRDIESCVEIMTALADGADAFEVNVSCFHSGALHGNLNVDRDHLERLMRGIRPATQLPIWVKLSYSTQIMEMALLAERLGADAIVTTNTIGPGLLLDPNTGRPLLGIKGGAGGVSGRAIFPIALRCVYEISQAVQIPVVGVGGIDSADAVVQMLLAGACAVQFYTAPALRGPKIFAKITRDLSAFLKNHERFRNVGDLIGVAHAFGKEHAFEAPPPKIIADKCTGCGECFPACAFDAIRFQSRGMGSPPVAVITNACNGCNACIGICPPELAAIQRTPR